MDGENCEPKVATSTSKARKIGIVGYGHLGKYLVEKILNTPGLELAFVWNRTAETVSGQVPDLYIIDDLKDIMYKEVDLIVEVCHPTVVSYFGELFLKHADFMVGSVTCLADAKVEAKLRAAATEHSIFIPTGSLWGAIDLVKMADNGTLQALKVRLTTPPQGLKVTGRLIEKVRGVKGDKAVPIFDGTVREICPLAPHNVNPMATAALAGHNLGFDRVQVSLIADPKLHDWNVVEVESWGPGDIATDTAFHVRTVRRSPVKVGEIGSDTLAAIFGSVLAAYGRGPGLHLC